jgi:hypothetical protein
MPAFGDVLSAGQIVDMPDLVKLFRLENVSGFAGLLQSVFTTSYGLKVTPTARLFRLIS